MKAELKIIFGIALVLWPEVSTTIIGATLIADGINDID